MRVSMVPVIVAMDVIVVERVMRVRVPVALGRVQIHPESNQHGGRERPYTGMPVAERVCDRRTDERSERKYGPRAPGSDPTLGEQIQPSAHAVACRSAREKHEQR